MLRGTSELFLKLLTSLQATSPCAFASNRVGGMLRLHFYPDHLSRLTFQKPLKRCSGFWGAFYFLLEQGFSLFLARPFYTDVAFSQYFSIQCRRLFPQSDILMTPLASPALAHTTPHHTTPHHTTPAAQNAHFSWKIRKWGKCETWQKCCWLF